MLNQANKQQTFLYFCFEANFAWRQQFSLSPSKKCHILVASWLVWAFCHIRLEAKAFASSKQKVKSWEFAHQFLYQLRSDLKTLKKCCILVASLMLWTVCRLVPHGEFLNVCIAIGAKFRSRQHSCSVLSAAFLNKRLTG